MIFSKFSGEQKEKKINFFVFYFFPYIDFFCFLSDLDKCLSLVFCPFFLFSSCTNEKIEKLENVTCDSE
jgi:hypothetical protein